MKRPVRAILIDPFKCEVTEVTHDAADYRNIYKLISHESMPVDCFTCVYLDDGDAIFVDDEGLLKPCDRFFKWRGYPQALAGRGLILGSDDEGDTRAAKIDIEEARKHLTYFERISPELLQYTDKTWEPA